MGINILMSTVCNSDSNDKTELSMQLFRIAIAKFNLNGLQSLLRNLRKEKLGAV